MTYTYRRRKDWAAFDCEAAVANAVPDEEDLADWEYCYACDNTSRGPCQECIYGDAAKAEAEAAQAEADAKAAALVAADEEEKRQKAEKEARKEAKKERKAQEKAEKKAREEWKAYLKASMSMPRIDDTDQEDWSDSERYGRAYD
ncbi:uncharacterized protein LOC62_07G009468 [Vanrija pseudolonga]|uniref:Uncharacterized protein n=1 Tax=Vanrija pseudolonga TaxID=143232 RepID=A0AAF1BQ90_9TREE|nr:hypothetical protein LOC62_07G009468 [Vanrija pseudolonga]